MKAIDPADVPGPQNAYVRPVHTADLRDFALHRAALAGQGIHAPRQRESRAVFQLPAVQAHPQPPAQQRVMLRGKGYAAQGLQGRIRRRQIIHDPVQHVFNALSPQGRPGQNGEYVSLPGQRGKSAVDFPGRDAALCQIPRHQLVVGVADDFRQPLRIADQGRLSRQTAANLGRRAGRVRAFPIHLIDKKEDRHFLGPQGLKEQLGLGLNPFHAADHDDRAVQRPKRAFDLRGKIRVAGGVDQVDFLAPPLEPHAGGPDRNAPAPLNGQGIRMGRSAVYAARAADGPRFQEHLLGQRGFSGVHMGKNADISHHGMPPRVRRARRRKRS